MEAAEKFSTELGDGAGVPENVNKFETPGFRI